jgi:iron-sulfur cluster assembly protein
MIAHAPITVTDTALNRLQFLLSSRGKSSAGIRIGIKTKGCSGLSYTLEFADAKNPFDEEMSLGNINIFIDPKATLFILGTEMDFVETEVQSGFTFTNPNEKGRCGCGKSFHV